jgi:hypothetical protein
MFDPIARMLNINPQQLHLSPNATTFGGTFKATHGINSAPYPTDAWRWDTVNPAILILAWIINLMTASVSFQIQTIAIKIRRLSPHNWNIRALALFVVHLFDSRLLVYLIKGNDARYGPVMTGLIYVELVVAMQLIPIMMSHARIFPSVTAFVACVFFAFLAEVLIMPCPRPILYAVCHSIWNLGVSVTFYISLVR